MAVSCLWHAGGQLYTCLYERVAFDAANYDEVQSATDGRIRYRRSDLAEEANSQGLRPRHRSLEKIDLTISTGYVSVSEATIRTVTSKPTA